MAERIVSIGLDVGTTSTQIVFSELTVENRAGAFAVPELCITDRRVLYKSPVHFTPLMGAELVDAAALRRIVDSEYASAGLTRADVDTGAIIITGETSRKENARAVLAELGGYAGQFVVAAAGPSLESALAARGAGAVRYSEQSGKTVLHMDIGGGTSNLAFIRDGKIVKTGCYNVGGRLIKLDENAIVTYLSPVLGDICDMELGKVASQTQVDALCVRLAQILEMAAGLRERTPLLERFVSFGADALALESGEAEVFSFSGGVADCLSRDTPWLSYGDIGPSLGRALRASRLCRDAYVLGAETIRATVIGAGCHSTQLSGSTVFYRNVSFPLKNLRVIRMEEPDADAIDHALSQEDGAAVLSLPGARPVRYRDIAAYAERIVRGFHDRAVLVCVEADMAKALGQAVAGLSAPEQSILCIDRVHLPEGSYLDVAAPVGAALPVVVKTLILER